MYETNGLPTRCRLRDGTKQVTFFLKTVIVRIPTHQRSRISRKVRFVPSSYCSYSGWKPDPEWRTEVRNAQAENLPPPLISAAHSPCLSGLNTDFTAIKLPCYWKWFSLDSDARCGSQGCDSARMNHCTVTGALWKCIQRPPRPEMWKSVVGKKAIWDAQRRTSNL